jgi:hypothetical protein
MPQLSRRAFGASCSRRPPHPSSAIGNGSIICAIVGAMLAFTKQLLADLGEGPRHRAPRGTRPGRPSGDALRSRRARERRRKGVTSLWIDVATDRFLDALVASRRSTFSPPGRSRRTWASRGTACSRSADNSRRDLINVRFCPLCGTHGGHLPRSEKCQKRS